MLDKVKQAYGTVKNTFIQEFGKPIEEQIFYTVPKKFDDKVRYHIDSIYSPINSSVIMNTLRALPFMLLPSACLTGVSAATALLFYARPQIVSPQSKTHLLNAIATASLLGGAGKVVTGDFTNPLLMAHAGLDLALAHFLYQRAGQHEKKIQ